MFSRFSVPVMFAVFTLAAAAGAQTPPAAGTPAPQPQSMDINTLPPGLKLGVRASFVQRQLGVAPTLVLVPDEASYVAAVSAWATKPDGAVRFPVLFDDGSYLAQQQIARFVRAFKPTSVVRWQAPEGKREWPKDTTARQTMIENAAASVWGAKSAADLKARFDEMKFQPPGVVVAWPDDAAWTGALALAAGRGQPILWIKPPHGDPDSAISPAQADDISRAITTSLDAAGYSYSKLGDTIDAVTIALSTGVKLQLPPEDKRAMLALTDVVGREPREPRSGRWAYASQLLGDRNAATYDAMCSMFLTPDRAWLVDGYDASNPWDMTKAAEPLARVGIKAEVADAPSGVGLSQVLSRLAGSRSPAADKDTSGFGVDAGFIAFNTSGNSDFFEMKPGTGRPVDMPILHRPASVYFVHSWSAYLPARRACISGMWRERGAYAYVGSVHEPLLGGFTQTPMFTTRLAAGVAWAAAPREDGGKCWKIAVFGDPLMTVGPQGPRLAADVLPLKDARSIADDLPIFLKEKKFTDALRTLALLGRDADAARLCLALAKDNPGALTPEAGLAGIGPCFIAGDYPAFLTAAKAAAPALADEARVGRERIAEVRDMVWHALYVSIGRASAEEAALLGAMLRPENLARDAGDAYMALNRTSGPQAAAAMLAKAKLLAKDRQTSDALDRLGR